MLTSQGCFRREYDGDNLFSSDNGKLIPRRNIEALKRGLFVWLNLLSSSLSMLLMNRFIDLWKILPVRLINCYFHIFLIFSFLLQLPISSSVPQIIKELSSSSSYSFHSRHLSFKCMTKKAISSQNITNQIDFSIQ